MADWRQAYCRIHDRQIRTRFLGPQRASATGAL
jgi:hypothetical protein